MKKRYNISEKNLKLTTLGFTLIELIAVLVILAILALIVTPLVMNIVKKAKDSANKRSVDAYGKAVELAVATHLLDYGEYPEKLDNLKVEYNGSEVTCNVKTLNDDGSIYLTECSVKGTEVKDSKTEDGYYHYGKVSGNYQVYSIGDIIEYNGMEFFAISKSNSNSDYVTVLKSTPLTIDEVNTYGVGHVNNYSNNSAGTAYDYNGYGGVQYYSSSTCYNGSRDGCIVDYDDSDVKYIVDAWSDAVLSKDDLKIDDFGYATRLITYDELINSLDYMPINSSRIDVIASATYDDVMKGDYYYWTMTPYYDYQNAMWFVSNGHLISGAVGIQGGAVRPVINLLKSAI